MKKYLAIIAITLSMAMPALAAETHGGEIFYTEPVSTVLFSHKLHVERKELSCDLCHARNFEMQALKVQKRDDFTMKSLMEGKYCGACHNGTMAFASNTRCGDCHAGVKRGGGTAQLQAGSL